MHDDDVDDDDDGDDVDDYDYDDEHWADAAAAADNYDAKQRRL